MRARDFISEMALPTEAMKVTVFYHGTKDDANGRSILEKGLVPGNQGKSSRGHLQPAAGKTYLTPDLKYGIIYCIGGDMLGCSEASVPYLIGKAGQYGWLFSVKGEKLQDVQPDEDSVGRAAMLAWEILRGSDPNRSVYKDDAQYIALLGEDKFRLQQFVYNAKQAMTSKQWEGTTFGLISAQASGGKRMLKTMGDEWKLWLLKCGAHVAHHGPVMPDHAWRFDKNLTPQLHKDGSNFFSLAQQIK